MQAETLTIRAVSHEAPAAPEIQVRDSGVLLPGESVRSGSAATAAIAPPHAVSDSPSADASPDSRRRALKRRALTVAVAALAILCVYAALRWWGYSHSYTKTDNAYLAAHIHQVSSRIAGTITEVLVEENQTVSTGAVLARLDPADFQLRVEQAKAEAAQAQARIQQANAQVAQAQAQVAREQAQAVKARRDLERAEALTQGPEGAISRQEFDQAKAAWDAAEAAHRAADSALQSALSLVAVCQAQEQAARATVRDAELQLSYTDVLAPTTGRIGRRTLEAGNRVQPGQTLLALVQPEVWVTANFKETQLAYIKPGLPVEIMVDTYPGRVFQGKVESLAPASGSQFALLPPDNATGNFTRIVQRVPVRIVFARNAMGEEVRLVPGMSAAVRVKVR